MNLTIVRLPSFVNFLEHVEYSKRKSQSLRRAGQMHTKPGPQTPKPGNNARPNPIRRRQAHAGSGAVKSLANLKIKRIR